jgi:hypothetical protein
MDVNDYSTCSPYNQAGSVGIQTGLIRYNNYTVLSDYSVIVLESKCLCYNVLLR